MDSHSNIGGIRKILNERGKRYGEFYVHASISQHLKDVMRGCLKWTDLSEDHKEALEMVQHKVARILNGDPSHIDSWDDIAGYATLVADRLRKDVGLNRELAAQVVAGAAAKSPEVRARIETNKLKRGEEHAEAEA